MASTASGASSRRVSSITRSMHWCQKAPVCRRMRTPSDGSASMAENMLSMNPSLGVDITAETRISVRCGLIPSRFREIGRLAQSASSERQGLINISPAWAKAAFSDASSKIAL